MENTGEKSYIGNKIFYIILGIFIVCSVGASFYRIVISKDYQIVGQVACDPQVEKCFVSKCDPETDDTCSKNLDEQTTYYKEISKKAASIYACEATKEKIGCTDNLSCISGESSCFYIFCNPANLKDGEQCAN